MQLAKFSNPNFRRGAPFWKEALWYLISSVLISSAIPGTLWRLLFLRAFGASIDVGVVIKPRIRVKFPWRLSIGAHSWIGESVWIDNIEFVKIGSDVCISQGTYVGTGNHDWSSSSFSLRAQNVEILDKAWLGANSVVCPGARVGEGAILTQGSVASGELHSWCIYRGNPAIHFKNRVISHE
jgi:putative colanic acid biosynthesis acetyltransferase WcaF